MFRMFDFLRRRTRPELQEPRKLALIIHNPRIPSSNGRKLNKVLGWNDPDQLVHLSLADLRDISYGNANYELVERIEVDGFPIKEDGFTYDPDDYVRFWHARDGFHSPDWVDYNAILNDHHIVDKVNRGIVDEVWLFAFPYAGYYESRMAGPGAFWCNAPPLQTTQPAKRRFVVMGLNYERGVGEMLESFGHRAESIMAQVYRHHRGEANMWERFIRYDKTHPQQSGVGNIHFAPNSTRDYEWGNRTPVVSCADDWLNYPNLTGTTRQMTCADWGHGDIRAHHRWWFERIPHADGVRDGVSNNWWDYIVDPNEVKI